MRLDQLERVEGDGAEGCDYCWVNQLDLPAEESRTVAKLRACRPVICAACFAGAAQHAVGDENVVTCQVNRSQKLLEVDSRCVSVEGNSSSIRTVAARCFRDQHHPGGDGPVEPAQYRAAIAHPVTADAGCSLLGKSFESRRFAHRGCGRLTRRREERERIAAVPRVFAPSRLRVKPDRIASV